MLCILAYVEHTCANTVGLVLWVYVRIFSAYGGHKDITVYNMYMGSQSEHEKSCRRSTSISQGFFTCNTWGSSWKPGTCGHSIQVKPLSLF